MLPTICALAAVGAVDATYDRIATTRATMIENAVRTYYTQHGKWPRQLADLTGLVEGGKDGLLNPWGVPYQYVLVPDEKGTVNPYTPCVWTEREVNGKARVYGKKPPGKGKE